MSVTSAALSCANAGGAASAIAAIAGSASRCINAVPNRARQRGFICTLTSSVSMAAGRREAGDGLKRSCPARRRSSPHPEYIHAGKGVGKLRFKRLPVLDMLQPDAAAVSLRMAPGELRLQHESVELQPESIQAPADLGQREAMTPAVEQEGEAS